MRKTETLIKDCVIIEPEVYGDHRGIFYESYNKDKFLELGIKEDFPQDNHSSSIKGVLRGMHFQNVPKQVSKLVRCTRGRLFDVCVDMRKDSPTYKKWFGVELSEQNRKMLYVPAGCAHGFYALEDCELLYKVGYNTYSKEHDANFAWDDKEIGIDWPLDGHPIISDRDKNATSFQNVMGYETKTQQKRVLVTGAGGMLGQDIFKIFKKAGYNVIATDRKELDITKQDAVMRQVSELKPDLIINTAAYNLVDNVEDESVYPIAYAVNVDGPLNLAEAAKANNIPFVHYSTDYVFRGDKPEGYREDDAPDPISKYGQTKYLGEQAVKQVGGHWYICRTSKIFGHPGITDMSKKSFVDLMLGLAKEKPEIKIVHEETGSPTYTKDIAAATLQLIEESYDPGIYHMINDGAPVTWYEFAEEIFKVAGIDTLRTPVSADTFGPRPAKRPKHAPLLNTKLPPMRARTHALKDYLCGHSHADVSESVSGAELSLVIVSWNVKNLLRQNLAKLFSMNCRRSFEVIVIDNGSIDGTVAMIRSEFPQVELIQNEVNKGFAYATNQGLRIANGNVLVLFNPDMLMSEGVLERVYEQLHKEKDIGVLGVKLVSEDGGSIVQSVRRDPSIKDQIAILTKLPHLAPKMLDYYLAKDFDYGFSQDVDQVRGSFFAFRKDVLEKVGDLDERFFVWFEEVDYCKRVRDAGYRVHYLADVKCVDLVGQGFKQIPVRTKQKHFSESMAKYFKKWHSPWHSSAISFLKPFAVLGGAIADLGQIFKR